MKEAELSNRIITGLVRKAQKVEIKNVFCPEVEDLLKIEALVFTHILIILK